MKTVRLGSNGKGKITNKVVKAMKLLRSLGNTVRDISVMFGVADSTVRNYVCPGAKSRSLECSRRWYHKNKKVNVAVEVKTNGMFDNRDCSDSQVINSFATRIKSRQLTKEQQEYIQRVNSSGVLSASEISRKIGVAPITVVYNTSKSIRQEKREYELLRNSLRQYGLTPAWLRENSGYCKEPDGIHLNKKGLEILFELHSRGVSYAELSRLLGVTYMGIKQRIESGSVRTMVCGSKPVDKEVKIEHNHVREYEAMELLRTRKVSLITTPFGFHAVRMEDGKFFDGQDPTEALLLSRKK